MSQDAALGHQGRLVQTLHLQPGNCTVELYAKRLENGALAVAALNRADASATSVPLDFLNVGVPGGMSVTSVRDLWGGEVVAFDRAGFRVMGLASLMTRRCVGWK